ncbi:MAG: MMPL family transporter [Thermodesulfobacteriota bacterium]
MSPDTTAEKPLYWLGRKLIEKRVPVMIGVTLVTAFFAYHTYQLVNAGFVTSFGDLLPQSHEFMKVHNKYAGTFGGANNVMVMFEVNDGHLFNVNTLTRIYRMTEELDKVYGVNHSQIDSIGHRTTRSLRVAAGGTMRSEPVMIGPPKTDEQAAEIRHIVHNTESIYGILVSLDDKAALLKANFIEGRLDYRRIFDEINERVVAPFGDGWVGAILNNKDDAGVLPPATVEVVFPGTPAEGKLEPGDTITAVDGKKVENRVQVAEAIAAKEPGQEVKLTVDRGGQTQDVSVTVPEPDVLISVAGEPRLYGWVYHYADEAKWIFLITTVLTWILLFLYFHDWRGALRPTITGVISAIWGLGFINLIGLPFDPLALVIPFFITARAVSHSVQMHDRYYEEYEKAGWDKDKAIVAAFAELFVPTLSGILTDAIGILAILLVPILMLQKLAISASFWILAITISELLLNPIVYYYLKAPDKETVLTREKGWFRNLIFRVTDAILSKAGRVATISAWVLLTALSIYFLKDLTIGDPTAASPLLWLDSPYNVSHTSIQQKFGGVEPLIIVAEGSDKDAMKDPQVLRTMEKFQRFLERDPDVGYSFSLADILRAVNMVFHELEPKWGVIPNDWIDVGGLFFVFFSGSPPSETAKYVTPDYATAHVTFYAKNHKGDNIRRIIERAKEFIAANPMEKAQFRLAGGLIGVLAAGNEEILKNDLLMNFLGFFTMYVIVLFTYRSWAAGIYLLLPLFLSNIAINAYMGIQGIGINISTLPVVTVGVGFGIDYGLYIVSRIIEEFQKSGDLEFSVREAVSTSGKAVTFTAVTMVLGTLVWWFSSIRFDAEMGLLLALWMAVSFIASMTLMPVLFVVFKPGFILRERPAIVPPTPAESRGAVS